MVTVKAGCYLRILQDRLSTKIERGSGQKMENRKSKTRSKHATIFPSIIKRYYAFLYCHYLGCYGHNISILAFFRSLLNSLTIFLQPFIQSTEVNRSYFTVQDNLILDNLVLTNL